jgi:hypothetical protein
LIHSRSFFDMRRRRHWLEIPEMRPVHQQRLTLSGRESSVELDVPKDFTGESIRLRILSDGWRGVDFEKTVA